jgi:hypothetical protein
MVNDQLHLSLKHGGFPSLPISVLSSTFKSKSLPVQHGKDGSCTVYMFGDSDCSEITLQCCKDQRDSYALQMQHACTPNYFLNCT